jgi:hypothetical protein
MRLGSVFVARLRGAAKSGLCFSSPVTPTFDRARARTCSKQYFG